MKTQLLLRNCSLFATLLFTSVTRADEIPWTSATTVDAIAAGVSIIATGDIDHDGKVDVVAAIGTNLVWYEAGAGVRGAFLVHQITASLSAPQRIRLADIDKDGWLDIIVSNSTGNVLVAFNDKTPANGGWAINTVVTGQGDVTGLAIADLDKDGDLDIAFSAPSTARVAWLENDGTPRTGSATVRIIASADAATDLDAADLNRDGFADLAVSNGAGGTSGSGIVWFANDNSPANGGWTRTVVANGQPSPFVRIVGADVNGDNHPDIVAARTDGTVLWYRSTGAGTFAAATLGTGVADPRAIVVADLDGDTDSDIAIASFSTDTIKWFDNPGGLIPTFTSRTLSTGIDGAAALAIADENNDGDLDAFSCAANAGQIVLRTNSKIHSTSQFAPFTVGMTMSSPSSSSLPRGLAAADFDNDGNLDIARTIEDVNFNNGLEWLENDSSPFTGSWSTHSIIGTQTNSLQRDCFAGDAEGDGDWDHVGWFALSAIDPNPPVGFMLNDGASPGSIWTREVESVTQQMFIMDSGDFDGDGDLDILFGEPRLVSGYDLVWFEFSPNSVIKWNRHTLSLNVPIDSVIRNAVAADLDADGDMDFVVADFDANGPHYYENQGLMTSTFIRRSLPNGSWSGDKPRFADFDRDGRLDIVFGTHLLRNLGGSPLAFNMQSLPVTPYVTLGPTASIQLKDIDRDGDTDVLAAEFDDAGTFEHIGLAECTDSSPLTFARREYAVPTSPMFEAGFADLNHDGLEDIFGITHDGVAHIDRLFFLQNRGGQAQLTATAALAPGAGIYDGKENAILAIDATHLGRAGDSSAELVRMNVLLEQLPGLQFTLPQITALFSSFAIWLDVNANGTLDPAVDHLVVRRLLNAHFPPTNPMVIDVPDATADATIAAIATRKYLLSAELTSNAHSVAVNQFIATLRLDSDNGPVGTAMEDAASDLPLRLAHRADAGTLSIPALCIADFNGDRTADFFDYLDFVDAFSAEVPSADFNADGIVDFFDYLDFVDAFSLGC